MAKSKQTFVEQKKKPKDKKPKSGEVEVFVMGKSYKVPAGLTIMKALEYAGYRLSVAVVAVLVFVVLVLRFIVSKMNKNLVLILLVKKLSRIKCT